ncbi:MAG: endonuclease Q family protein, partial [Candidatus Omnitrophica bacterium]|nr:endonuclease Q family protein [Candidatus Omnitrophota bacterium]
RDANQVKADKIPFKHLVPLDQIIASVYKKDVNSVFVRNIYSQSIQKLGPELNIFLEIQEKELFKNLSEELAMGIKMVKEGKVFVSPGYDGEFGKIEIRYDIPEDPVQQTLF